MRGSAFGLALRARPRRGSAMHTPSPAPTPAPTPTPPPAPAPITAINTDGWSAEWAGGTPPSFAPDTAPQTIPVSRPGFDAAAQAIVHVGTRLFTRRRRQVYPAQASDTPSTVALDDYVYATDTIAGVANHSAETSPLPVAAWAMPHRRVVADTLDLEAVAFHREARDGRMVAAVRFVASDGVASVTQVVAETALSIRGGDRQPLPVYAATLDISSLATGMVTVNAEVYPWIGDAASVLRSADRSAPREFSPRHFLRHPALAAAPPYAYVAAGGSDAGGLVSTDAAAAAAAPFGSVKGAIDAVHAAFATSTGVDGAVVRIGAGSFPLASATTDRVQRIAALTITRDPAVPRAAAIVTWGSAVFAPRLASGLAAPIVTGCLRFHDVTVQRTGPSFLQGQAAAHLEIQWDDVGLDNGGFGTWLTRSSNTFTGAVVTNGQGGWLGATSSGEHRLVRGVSADLADSGWENWVTLASALTRPGAGALRDPTKGAIAFQNRILNPNPNSSALAASTVNAGETVTGFWVVQNLIEVLRAGGGPAVRISSDTVTNGNTDHCGVGHNTVTGHGGVGRYNLFYDNNTNGSRRTHRRMWHKGDIVGQLNTKGDIDLQDAAATGMFAYHHGVGCQGNLTQFRTNSPGLYSEFQAYPGRRSNIGTSATVRNDPLFVDYRGVTTVNGTGGGDYRLQPGSPARGIVLTGTLSHDLAGMPRPVAGNDHAGAYA